MRKSKKWRVMKSEATGDISVPFHFMRRWECLVILKLWGPGSFCKLKSFSTKKVLPQIFTIFLPYLPITAGEFLSMLYTLLATLWGTSIFFGCHCCSTGQVKGGWREDGELFEDRDIHDLPRHPSALEVLAILFSIEHIRMTSWVEFLLPTVGKFLLKAWISTLLK